MDVATAPKAEIAKAALRVARPGQAAGAGKSSQPDPDDRWTPDESIPPPLDLELLASQTMVSRTRRSCIEAIARNTVGLGFTLTPREGAEQDVSAEELADLQTELDELARRDRQLGAPSFTRLMHAAMWDKQEVGQGYLEVSRNRLTGRIDGLYHPPGKRIRRKADRSGWVMGPKGASGSELTHFHDFGEKVQYDEATGEPKPLLKQSAVAGGQGWNRNELIVFRLYTSQSVDYGLPPDAQLAIDYLGDKLAGKSNVGFFSSNGVPPTVIFVQGREATDGENGQAAIEVEIDDEFTQAIADTLTAGGADSRVAVVGVPPGTKTDKHDLSVNSARDLGHVNYRADNRRATLGAFRLSPIFVADIEDAGKYTAEVERGITKEQVFDPEQEETADILGQSILRELNPSVAIDFNEIEIKGDEAKRESADALADRGKITNGEYREAHGYAPMPERQPGEADPAEIDEATGEPKGEADGKVPAGWNDQLVDPNDKARSLMPLAADPEQAAELAKRSSREILRDEIEGEFERTLDDAVRTVQSMTDDAEIRPVIVAKGADGSITITPYEGPST